MDSTIEIYDYLKELFDNSGNVFVHIIPQTVFLEKPEPTILLTNISTIPTKTKDKVNNDVITYTIDIIGSFMANVIATFNTIRNNIECFQGFTVSNIEFQSCEDLHESEINIFRKVMTIEVKTKQIFT